jgi:hypothetical protein
VLNARRSTSLRVRLMFFTAVLAVLFMLALLAAVRGAFLIALEQSVEKRLASEANALISVARLDDGRLSMPEKLPDEKLNTLEAKVDHSVDSVRSPTTDADDLDYGEVVIARARCRIRFAVCHHGLRDP